jgi:hypothetical protein
MKAVDVAHSIYRSSQSFNKGNCHFYPAKRDAIPSGFNKQNLVDKTLNQGEHYAWFKK